MKNLLKSCGIACMSLVSACVSPSRDVIDPPMERAAAAPALIASVTGLSGPEGVRYDPDFDLYFVSNFNGDSSGDANGFVSKVSADGELMELRFAQGTERWPLHGGRGMWVDERGLWVVDAGGVHLFSRNKGEQLHFFDFSAYELGFPNDIVKGPDGLMYVTDTGTSTVYRIAAGEVSPVASTEMKPNGITLNPANGRLVLAPWEGALELVEWDIGEQTFYTVGALDGGGNYDGVEAVQGSFIIASQADTSLHIMTGGNDRRAIDLPGRPADIGIDTKRNRVAVPYVSLNRVDIFALDGQL